MSEELRRLVQIHPQIEEQRTILRRAQESVTTARSGYYPSVSVTGSYGNEITSNPTTRLANDDNDALLFNALGIEVRQSLFNGLQTDNSVDAAIMARDSVAFAMNSTVQTVMLQGITSYINILRLNELIRVSRARERTIREQLDLETARVERGAGIEVDVLQAKSRLQIAIEQRVDLEGQLRQAEAAYVQAFQRQPDITRMRLDPPPVDVLPASIDEALFMGREENPLVRAREFLSRSARFTIDATRAGYFPTFDAVARWDHEYNVSHVRDDVKKSAILIEMSWDLFAGFATDSAVSSAQQSLLESFAIADRTLHQVERQVRTAWIKLENTRQRKELLLNAVSIAQEVFVARQRLREAGRETTPNVLDAESEVFQAESNLIRADYDARVAVYELVAAMGILTPALLGIDVAVIEDIDQYFSAEDEVRDLAPIEEIEARRREIEELRAAGQRDSLIPEPGLISSGSSTQENLVDPNVGSTGNNDDSVIEPPPVQDVPADDGIGGVGEIEEEPLEESRSQTPVNTALGGSESAAFDVQDSSLPLSGPANVAPANVTPANVAPANIAPANVAPANIVPDVSAPASEIDLPTATQAPVDRSAANSPAIPEPVVQGPNADVVASDPARTQAAAADAMPGAPSHELSPAPSDVSVGAQTAGSTTTADDATASSGSGDFISGVRRLLGLDRDDTVVTGAATADRQAEQSSGLASDNAQIMTGHNQPARQAATALDEHDRAGMPTDAAAQAPVRPAPRMAPADQASNALPLEDGVPMPLSETLEAAASDHTGSGGQESTAAPRDIVTHPDAAVSQRVQADALPREVSEAQPVADAGQAQSADVVEVAEEPGSEEVADPDTQTAGSALQERPAVAALPAPPEMPHPGSVSPPDSAQPVPYPDPVVAPPRLPETASGSDESLTAAPRPAMPEGTGPAEAGPVETGRVENGRALPQSVETVSYPLGSNAGGAAVDGDVLTTRLGSQAGFDIPGMILFGDAPEVPMAR